VIRSLVPSIAQADEPISLGEATTLLDTCPDDGEPGLPRAFPERGPGRRARAEGFSGAEAGGGSIRRIYINSTVGGTASRPTNSAFR
jgi:hypothetical protein